MIVVNYLHRPLWPPMLAAVGDGGVLLYETFARGQERFGKPSNPDFLLKPGELLDVVRGRLEVIAFEQGEIEGSERRGGEATDRGDRRRQRLSRLPSA